LLVRNSRILPEPQASSLEPYWVLLAFCALAVFWTWPLATTLSSRIPHDAGDPVLNTWILWWNAQAVPFTGRWWSPPILWPMPDAMALSEHLVGSSLVATPLQLAGANAIAAYNVCLLLTYVLSGFFCYLLAQRLTGSTLAGICAGLAFGFSPHRAGQLAHIQVLSAQWMPLALLGLHAYLSTGAVRWLVVFGIAWLIQAMSNGYYLLFFPILTSVWLAWFVDWRNAPRRGIAIAGAWAVASLPLLPILLKYHAVHERLGLTRKVQEIREFSALPESFLDAPPLLRLWPAGPAPTQEHFLFPGVTVVLLAVAGLAMLLWKRGPRVAIVERSPLVFYVAATLLMWTLALGPGGEGIGSASPLRPYTWLLLLPGFDGLRVPGRFAMIGSLCLAVAASLALAHLVPAGGRRRLIVGALVVAGLSADGLMEPLPVVVPPGRVVLPGSRQSAVLELPADNTYVSVAAMYRSIIHRQPLVNGYSGHAPPHYNVLSLSLARGDTSGLLYLARGRPLVIIVNDILDPGHGFRAMVESIPGIETHGLSAAGSVFLLPAQPQVRLPPAGPALTARVREVGSYRLEADLGAPETITAIEFPLRWRYQDLAARLRIEGSEDGQNWREVWTGWTGGLALEATLADPRTAPVRIGLPYVKARYLRVYPASEWMKTELRVLGH